MNDKNDELETAIVRLLGELFHTKFCVENNITADKRYAVQQQTFCEWLLHEWSTLDIPQLMTTTGTDEETWQAVHAMLTREPMIQMPDILWFAVVLADRKPPTVPVKTVNLICNITFADGTIATTQSTIFADSDSNSKPFDDATLFGALHDVMRYVWSTMASLGLTALHKDAQQFIYTSTHQVDPFEVFMGWILKYLIRGEPMVNKLPPELVKPVESYMRLAQQCIRPPIPPSVMQAARSGAKPKPVGGARGGWDV